MNTAKEILELIEAVDPKDTAKMDEIFVPLEFTGNLYSISAMGSVKSSRRVVSIGANKRVIDEKILKPSIGSSGYKLVTLHLGNGKKVTKHIHRLLAEAFLGCKPEQVARHLDGNKLNNSVINLSCGSHKENTKDRISHGTMFYGSDVHNSILSECDVIFIRTNWKFRCKQNGTMALAKKYRVSPSTISAVKNGQNWSHIQAIEYERTKS